MQSSSISSTTHSTFALSRALRLAAIAAMATLLAPLSAQDWGSSHSQRDLQQWLAGIGEHKSDVQIRDAMNRAKANGWLRSAADKTLFKKQFRSLSRDQGGHGRQLRFVDRQKVQNPSAFATVSEREFNDSEGFGMDLGTVSAATSQTVTGALQAGEVDSFRFKILVDGVITLTNTINSGSVPDMEITNAQGDEIWGMASTATTKLTMPLPAGTYCVRVFAPGSACTYSLNVAQTAQTMPLLTLNQTTTGSLLAYGTVGYKVVLTQSGRLDIRISSTVTATDSYLWLLNQNWGYVYYVDTDYRQSGNHAGLNALLPAGTYYIYLQSDTATASSIKTTFTAATIPTLGAGKTLSGTIPGGEEDFDTYLVQIGSNESNKVSINGDNTSSSILDSYLFFYDAKMGLALESDDSAAGVSTLSATSFTLPAGTYYAASTGYWDYGNYVIGRGTVATGATTVAYPGVLTGNMSGDLAQTYRLTLKTPSRIELSVVEGSLYDAQIFVVDSKGQQVTWADESLDNNSCSLGAILPVGEYYIMVKDWDGGTGSYSLYLNTPLTRDASDKVIGFGQGGSTVFAVISGKEVAASNPLAGLVDGNLLVDLNGALIFPLTLPTSGKVATPYVFKFGNGLFGQTVEFPPVQNQKGTYSNLLK